MVNKIILRNGHKKISEKFGQQNQTNFIDL